MAEILSSGRVIRSVGVAAMDIERAADVYRNGMRGDQPSRDLFARIERDSPVVGRLAVDFARVCKSEQAAANRMADALLITKAKRAKLICPVCGKKTRAGENCPRCGHSALCKGCSGSDVVKTTGGGAMPRRKGKGRVRQSFAGKGYGGSVATIQRELQDERAARVAADFAAVADRDPVQREQVWQREHAGR